PLQADVEAALAKLGQLGSEFGLGPAFFIGAAGPTVLPPPRPVSDRRNASAATPWALSGAGRRRRLRGSGGGRLERNYLHPVRWRRPPSVPGRKPPRQRQRPGPATGAGGHRPNRARGLPAGSAGGRRCRWGPACPRPDSAPATYPRTHGKGG